MDKRKRDSSPAAPQDPPAKRPCTTSGPQCGGDEPSRPEIHAAQPERSTSPQPSTSGLERRPKEPQISTSPQLSVSGSQQRPKEPSASDSDSDSDFDFNFDSDSDSDSDFDFNFDSDPDSVFDFNFDSDSDSDSQDERTPLMINSAAQARRGRTPSQQEVPLDQPGMSSGPEPPPPGLQRGGQQEEAVTLYNFGGVRVEESGDLPIVHFPAGFPHSASVECLAEDMARLPAAV